MIKTVYKINKNQYIAKEKKIKKIIENKNKIKFILLP